MERGGLIGWKKEASGLNFLESCDFRGGKVLRFKKRHGRPIPEGGERVSGNTSGRRLFLVEEGNDCRIKEIST